MNYNGYGFFMTDESQVVRLTRKSKKMEREIRRLRNTASFRIGLHLTKSVSNPLRLIALPISFPIFCFMLVLERIGKLAKPKFHEEEVVLKRQHSIVLFPTNGVGFGHFTRLYALAQHLRSRDEDLEIVFFTPMPTLHIPYSENFLTYHLAGRYKHQNLPANQWNALTEEMLRLVLEIHRPKWFVFDGAFPYRGMLDAINSEPAKKIWIRRGTFKKGASIPVDSIAFFDTIIHPNDSIEEEFDSGVHSVDTRFVAPISLIDSEKMMSREQVRKRFNIAEESFVVYVQLGAGRINDINSDIRIVIDTVLENPKAHIVLGESMLGERLDIEFERVTIIRDYPNAIYLNGFDMSIQAGGYNSYHEMRIMKMPTIFIPNQNTGMDNQLARCKVAEREKWGVVLTSVTKENLRIAIDGLSKIEPGFEQFENGAASIASMLLEGEL